MDTFSLRNNRFFGRPTQWAPEEALNDIEHYGPHTELWYFSNSIIVRNNLLDIKEFKFKNYKICILEIFVFIFRHIGLLIPEMVTGETFHLTNVMYPKDVKQYAEQLVSHF